MPSFFSPRYHFFSTHKRLFRFLSYFYDFFLAVSFNRLEAAQNQFFSTIATINTANRKRNLWKKRWKSWTPLRMRPKWLNSLVKLVNNKKKPDSRDFTIPFLNVPIRLSLLYSDIVQYNRSVEWTFYSFSRPCVRRWLFACQLAERTERRCWIAMLPCAAVSLAGSFVEGPVTGGDFCARSSNFLEFFLLHSCSMTTPDKKTSSTSMRYRDEPPLAPPDHIDTHGTCWVMRVRVSCVFECATWSTRLSRRD